MVSAFDRLIPFYRLFGIELGAPNISDRVPCHLMDHIFTVLCGMAVEYFIQAGDFLGLKKCFDLGCFIDKPVSDFHIDQARVA